MKMTFEFDDPAKALKFYIRSNFDTIQQFCDKSGIHRLTLHKILSGKVYPSVRTQKLIEFATDGYVKFPEKEI